MFEIDPSHYRNFIFGIISKKNLARRKWHTFTLWNEELILFGTMAMCVAIKIIAPTMDYLWIRGN